MFGNTAIESGCLVVRAMWRSDVVVLGATPFSFFFLLLAPTHLLDPLQKFQRSSGSEQQTPLFDFSFEHSRMDNLYCEEERRHCSDKVLSARSTDVVST